MRAAAAAWRHRRAALAALAVGEYGEAFAHARRAMVFQRSEDGLELLFVARLLAG